MVILLLYAKHNLSEASLALCNNGEMSPVAGSPWSRRSSWLIPPQLLSDFSLRTAAAPLSGQRLSLCIPSNSTYCDCRKSSRGRREWLNLNSGTFPHIRCTIDKLAPGFNGEMFIIDQSSFSKNAIVER